MRQRSARLRSVYESAKPALRFARVTRFFSRAASVYGIRPSGGSTIRDVRLSRVSWTPRS